MSRDSQFLPSDLPEPRQPQEPASRLGPGQDHQADSPDRLDDSHLARERQALREIIDQAALGRPTVSEFLDRLAQRQVIPIASLQQGGRWSGIVYEYHGLRFRGAQLGRPCTAKGLQQRRGIDYQPARDQERLARSRPTPRPHDVKDRTSRRADRLRDALGLSLTERAVLWDIGRFRSVEVSDLGQARYGGHQRPLQRDLRHLAAAGYIELRILPADGRGRRIEIACLAPRGRRALRQLGAEPNGRPTQKLYSGLRQLRQIVHDAALYRMYLAEEARIEKQGGRVRRVLLDCELKQRAYSRLAQARDLPPLEYAELQQQIAEENQLQVVNGHLVFPDLRIESLTADGQDRRMDLELVTRNYRAAHVQSKAAAGFRIYADTESGALARVLDDHDLIAELLRM